MNNKKPRSNPVKKEYLTLTSGSLFSLTINGLFFFSFNLSKLTLGLIPASSIKF